MNYSELVFAAQKNDQDRLNAILSKLFPTLVDYLCATMSCPVSDAEDCVQQAILDTLEKIKDDKIRRPDSVYPYLLKTCRNNYFRLKKLSSKMVSDEHYLYLTNPPEQIRNLLVQEELNIVRECMDTLSSALKSFIEYIIDRPGIDTAQIAEEFQTSIPGVWSKKHRVIQILAKCVKLKMKEP